MQMSLATEPGAADRPNEDFALAGPDTVLVLDGAGLPDGTDTGCAHGVVWFVRRLGAALLRHATGRDAPLTECLADALTETAAAHGPRCDLGHPMTPTATVAVLRRRDEQLDWLVLADSTLLLDLPSGVRAVSDHRVGEVTDRQQRDLADRLAGLAPRARRELLATAQRGAMNTPDGYWVAGPHPAAAGHALTGGAPAAGLRLAALLTDGAARPVDDFAAMTWPDARTLLHTSGPQALVDRTRTLELTDPHHTRWPRAKTHDDATAVLLRP
ncbi:protein phosphatase 2C domain-containing protein [Streptomyces sp. TLI_171]|uniref:protein phosphatase 2C domain-containing protein n=1 Tax=Streptomyces sp. TLI_171 TaxID=1938859 RepID=UPI000C18796E|nr:protein phosphatase 2C domain-containing protein [Streptomyces sp. TLI_171]RKE20995.1 protein phosphatase 2C-like protein [Streptomyces sp. TLI_171]